MSNKRTIYLGLDYSDFTGGISEVNRKMQLLDAEFKLATEQAKNYGTETDKVGIKQEYLAQKIELQNRKVQEAKKAYDTVISSKKSTQKEIDSLDKKLLQERITLEKLNGQLKDTTESTDDLKNNTETFGDTIRNLTSDLGLNVSPAIEKLASKFDNVSKEVGTAIVGIGAIISSFVGASLETANFADDLLTLSSVTGITTDELQKMQYASDFLDVELDIMTGSITKLTRSMYDARGGSNELEKAFKALHVRVTDSRGNLRDANTVFYETIDALGKIKNETERDAIAMKVMGKSAKELNPLIQAGSERLKELGIEAENMGVIMGETSLDKLGALKDAMDKFENTSEALKNSLGLSLLPMITALFTAISSIPVPVLKTLVVLASVIATIVLLVKAIKSVTDTGKTIKSFFDATNISTLKTTGIILGVVAALVALATVIAVITGKSGELQQSMNSVGNSIGAINSTVENTQTRVRTVANHANGTKNYLGGTTWINEDVVQGPELIELPNGSKIYNGKETSKMLGGDTVNYYYITIPADTIEEFNDIIMIAKGQKQAYRRGIR